MKDETLTEKLYARFKKLKEEAVEDCLFNKTDMDSAFNNTNKIIKYINIKSEWNRVYRNLEAKRKDAYRKSFSYYQTDYPLKLNSKEEYQLFIESDPSYTDIFNQCQITKEVVTYVDSVLDALKGRGFEIKHALEYLKFSNGQ